MVIIEIFAVMYYAIGLILSIVWWTKENKLQYDEEKNSKQGVEDSMAVLLLLFFTLFWPIKLIKNITKKKN